MVLYIERWLKAPDARKEDGEIGSALRRARRKAESLALCWPICFCTMPLIGG